MDIFDSRYYKLNKRLFCAIAQWPYQNFWERSFTTFVYVIMIISLFIPEVLRLLQIFSQINIAIECSISLILMTMCFINITNCIINADKLRFILLETEYSWQHCARSLSEVKILRDYGERGRYWTILYVVYLTGTVIVWVTVPLIPVILNYFAPLNETRDNIPMFQTDYKIDPDKYFYVIYIHGFIVTIITIVMYAAVDSMFMSLSQHACAMFEILRFRLLNVIRDDEKTEVNLNPDLREDFACQEIVSCIKEHKRALRYIKILESYYEWPLFLMLGLNTLIMSFTGARTVAKSSDTKDVVRFGLFTVGTIIHLYCNSLPGQWIIDSSSRFRESAYSCKWYLLSLRSRKVLLLLIRQSIEPCSITAGNIFVMSMENFCSVLQTSMSYFTLLTSVQ